MVVSVPGQADPRIKVSTSQKCGSAESKIRTGEAKAEDLLTVHKALGSIPQHCQTQRNTRTAPYDEHVLQSTKFLFRRMRYGT